MRHNWNEVLFEQVYDRIHAMLCERRRLGESRQSIRDQLEWEYFASGVDPVEKGEVWQVSRDATIAAYEEFLTAWEDEGSE